MPNKIVTAGKELLKLNVGNAFKSLFPSGGYSETLNPGQYRDGNFWAYLNDSPFYPFTYENRKSSLTAYQQCPPLAAIVNRKAQAYINGKIWVMNSRGKEAQGPEASKIRKLLTNPNPLQSWRQFEAQTYIYQQIFGYAVWMPMIPVGYEQYGPIEAESLWNLPPHMVEIEEADDVYYKTGAKLIKKITLVYRNTRTPIDPASVFILKDFVPSFKSIVLPDSRIVPLTMNINNIIGALESENVIINKRGPDIMISSDAKDGAGVLPIRPDDKDKLENDFMSRGLKRSQSRVIITSAATKIENLTFNVKDLMLHESIGMNSRSICDVYNYPPHLLGLLDPTYNNQNAAEKGLYNNAIIPEATSNAEQLTSIFRLTEYNLRIEKDFSQIPVLQEDMRAGNMARKTLDEALKIEFDSGLITLNDWLVELGRDPIGDLGNVRATDMKNSNIPLAVTIGVGGVQGIVEIVSAQGISPEAKSSILQIVFGISPADANNMVQPSSGQQNNDNGQQQQQAADPQGGQAATGNG